MQHGGPSTCGPRTTWQNYLQIALFSLVLPRAAGRADDACPIGYIQTSVGLDDTDWFRAANIEACALMCTRAKQPRRRGVCLPPAERAEAEVKMAMEVSREDAGARETRARTHASRGDSMAGDKRGLLGASGVRGSEDVDCGGEGR